jgi:hypothetical protein
MIGLMGLSVPGRVPGPFLSVGALAAHDAWFADVTSGDGHGHGTPPRIVVATDAEPRTVLTRTKWRPSEGAGFGVAGTWWLFVPAPAKLDAREPFLSPVESPTVEVGAGGLVREVCLSGAVTEVSLGAFDLPGGPCNLTVRVTSGGSLVPPEHIVLTRVRN